MFPQERAAEEFVQAVRNQSLEKWKKKYNDKRDDNRFIWNMSKESADEQFSWLRKSK